jgi:formate/nitrite transporter FocA (FNT family)
MDLDALIPRVSHLQDTEGYLGRIMPNEYKFTIIAVAFIGLATAYSYRYRKIQNKWLLWLPTLLFAGLGFNFLPKWPLLIAMCLSSIFWATVAYQDSRKNWLVILLTFFLGAGFVPFVMIFVGAIIHFSLQFMMALDELMQIAKIYQE